MRWPSQFYQQPHQDSDGQRVNKMVKKSNRKETKDEWRWRLPKPEVLVQNIKRDDCAEKYQTFHKCYLECCLGPSSRKPTGKAARNIPCRSGNLQRNKMINQ